MATWLCRRQSRERHLELNCFGQTPKRVAWNVDTGSASFVVPRDVEVDHPTLDRSSGNTCKEANRHPDCEPLLVCTQGS